MGGIKCIIRRERTVRVEKHRFILAVTSASPDKECLKDHGVYLTVTQMEPEQLIPITLEGSAYDTFGYWGTLIPTTHVSPTSIPPFNMEHWGREGQKDTDAFISELISADPFTASKLPPWPQGQLQPELPYELGFQPLTDRETYEAVRQLDQMVFCWKKDETELHCTALAPRRRPWQIDLFVVHGFNGFREMNGNEAIQAIVTGKATRQL